MRFAVQGKIPELWNPMTGEITRLAQFSESDNGTQVSLYLEVEESAFIVFKESSETMNPVVAYEAPENENPLFYFDTVKNASIRLGKAGNYRVTMADGTTWEKEVSDIPKEKALDKNWHLQFDVDFGYGDSIKTDTLFDWTNSEIFDVQHYSGTVSYSNTFDLGDHFIGTDTSLILDLGEVNIAAKVFLNETEMATLWMPPFTLDITEQAKKGENNLRIEVTNTWTNRLIGDENYSRTDGYELKTAGATPPKMPEWYVNDRPMPASKRITFSAYPFYKKTDTLMPAGLVGPVKLKSTKTIRLGE